MVNREDILKEKELYWKSVLFFATLSEHFESIGIKHEVEQDVEGEDGYPKTPDFIILDGDIINDILEHKASLPNKEELVLKELEDTEKKYSNIKYKGKNHKPNLFLLCPKTCEEIIDKIKGKNKSNVSLCIFNLDLKEGEIKFYLCEEPNTKNDLINLLHSGNISFRIDDFSKYKFIKKEPHPVYTAWILWSVVLAYFKDPYSIKKESIKVQYDNMIEQASSLFQPWIRNLNQITRRRVNKALEFLNKIGFVNWKPGSSELEFFHRRGTKILDIVEYFVESWVKVSKLKPSSTEKTKGKQKGLSEFMK